MKLLEQAQKAIKTIGGEPSAKPSSSLERSITVVRYGRGVYNGTAVLILWAGYMGWRNARVKPGKATWPFPGLTRLKPKYPVDRPNDDSDAGYGGPGAAVSVGSVGGRKPGKADIDPGGGYAGSEGVVKALTQGYEQLGLTITSEKENRGTGSDHDLSSTTAYARDISNSSGNTSTPADCTPEMDRFARVVMARLGAHYTGGKLEHTSTVNGYRIQVLYRTTLGGNHYNHVHTGARKV